MAGVLARVALPAISGAAIATVVHDRYARLYWLQGPSMLPTIRPGKNLTLVDRRCLARYDLSRGDVVIFRLPSDHRAVMCQRLIALPGDWIQIPDKRVIRQIPEGHCWVEGDNARNSWDSRAYGPVPLGLMDGRVTYIIWPPDRIGRVNRMMPEGRIIPRQ